MIDMEIFKIVIEFPIYEVSNHGNIRKALTRQTIKPHTGKTGYIYVSLRYKKRTFNRYVHRLVGKAHIYNKDNKPQINHIDGVKSNNNVSNLEWVTCSENHKHAYRLGLMSSGEKHPHAKLKNKDIPIIRKMIDDGIKKEYIGEIFGVGWRHIYKIQNGEIWLNP